MNSGFFLKISIVTFNIIGKCDRYFLYILKNIKTSSHYKQKTDVKKKKKFLPDNDNNLVLLNLIWLVIEKYPKIPHFKVFVSKYNH